MPYIPDEIIHHIISFGVPLRTVCCLNTHFRQEYFWREVYKNIIFEIDLIGATCEYEQIIEGIGGTFQTVIMSTGFDYETLLNDKPWLTPFNKHVNIKIIIKKHAF